MEGLGMMMMGSFLWGGFGIYAIYGKKGELIQKNWVFYLISLHLASLAGIQYTIGRGNLQQEVLGIVLFVLAAIPYIIKNSHFEWAKRILAVMLFVSPLVVFFVG